VIRILNIFGVKPIMAVGWGVTPVKFTMGAASVQARRDTNLDA